MRDLAPWSDMDATANLEPPNPSHKGYNPANYAPQPRYETGPL